MEFPLKPHSAIITGPTSCGKTEFILDLLEGPYRGVFEHIVIACPSVRYNETYRARPWVWSDREVFIFDPGDRLLKWLEAFYKMFQGTPTLYIIDDCSAEDAIAQKRTMLTYLAFSGRHAQQSLWVQTQKYNAVAKGLRAQTQWVALFHSKDKDSFEDCLDENYIIHSREERDGVRKQLETNEFSKLVLRTKFPFSYKVLKAGEVC